ncbi:MAG: RNA polymerase subunit sigma-70 [Solirubrobacterales bacterium 70-9]|nr:MAG: RNA polymerase subunit sigma-70 [Solirubrobacterales bacterium 70-9]
MEGPEALAEQFEAARPYLEAVAYRMLGSVAESEDAVQESWLRLSRSDAGAIEDLRRWLTTVVARVCLDQLRSRRARREEPLGPWVPEPLVAPEGETDPEHEAVLADSVGLALLVVLESMPPAERLAFVLHDMFAVPFDEIAPIVDRTPDAARQLASRGRRRVRGSVPQADPDPTRQREVIDAFVAAAREGDFEALVALLDPDVVFRVDRGDLPGPPSRELRGARSVAENAVTFGRPFFPYMRRALVNGTPGVVIAPAGKTASVAGFVVRDGRIVEIDLLADPRRLGHVDIAALED